LLISELYAGKNSFLWEGTTPKVVITDPNQIKEVLQSSYSMV